MAKRIGNAERDAAIDALRDHLAAGRLTMDEFDERMSEALQAKTSEDLFPLFEDLPSSPLETYNFSKNFEEPNKYKNGSLKKPSSWSPIKIFIALFFLIPVAGVTLALFLKLMSMLFSFALLALVIAVIFGFIGRNRK